MAQRRLDSVIASGTDDYDPTFLRHFLRKARYDAGLTQDEVSKLTGIYKSVISRIEKGDIENPKFQLVAKLAYVYGIDLNEIAEVSGLKVKQAPRSPAEIKDARLRMAVERLDTDDDDHWKQHIITTLYMLVMSKNLSNGSNE